MDEAFRNRLLTDANMTIGEIFSPAMSITTKPEANEYFKALVDRSMAFMVTKDLQAAIKITKDNLGYYAGYYDHETRKRVEELFNCEHPIFGGVTEHQPSPEECFEAGMTWAEKYKKTGNKLEVEKIKADKKTYWDWIRSDE